jgi:hypothetical protein
MATDTNFNPGIKYQMDFDPKENKFTFNAYMKMCWQCSNSNLHYLDFCRLYEASMKKMFNPYKA